MRRGFGHGAGALALALLAGCAQPPPAASPPAVPPPAEAAVTPVPPAEANVALPALLELRTTELMTRFGPPTQQRRDGGAVIWNYEAAGICRLNLVLQRERGGQKVVHASARLAPGVAEEACLRRLERRR